MSTKTQLQDLITQGLILAVLCCLLAVASSGCVPVNYDTEVWDKDWSEPREVDGLEVSINIDSVGSNALNSRNWGGFVVLIGFSSQNQSDVRISRIVVRSKDCVLRDYGATRNISLIKHSISDQWDYLYRSSDALELGKDAGTTIYVDVYASSGDKSPMKFSSRFRRRTIKGGAVVNILTM